jgi:hypothetical protein
LVTEKRRATVEGITEDVQFPLIVTEKGLAELDARSGGTPAAHKASPSLSAARWKLLPARHSLFHLEDAARSSSVAHAPVKLKAIVVSG